MRFKNEVVVGLVVLVGILVTVLGAFWLSGKPWGKEQRELVAIFAQVGLLRNGNPVEYRGVQVGRVTDIQLSSNGQGVLVTMEVDPDITLPPQPAVMLAPASLFGDWQASLITQSSQPDMEFTATRTPGILPGTTLPDITQLTAVGARIASDIETLAARVEVAFTEETALKIRQTIENVQQVSERLTGFVDQQTRVYAQVGQDVRSTTQNIEKSSQSVQRMATRFEGALQPGGEIEQILANARQASQNLEQLSTQLQTAASGVPQLVARADTTLSTLNQVAVSVNGMVQQVGPQVQELGPTIAEARQAMATLQRAAARIESGEGTLGRLLEDPALYEETQRAIATLQRVLADVQANPAKYIGSFKIF